MAALQQVKCLVKRVQRAPEDERPGGAMPQATQQEYDPDIAEQFPEAFPVPSKGDIDIVLEPCGKRDVPPPPELDEAGRKIWAVEIDHEPEAEEPRDAARAIRISAEVAVDLDGKEDCTKDASRGRVELRHPEHGIDIERQRVGDDHLLEQPVRDE